MTTAERHTPSLAPATPAPAQPDLLRIYRLMLVARATDERMWILSRQGKAGFVLTSRGHEAAQIASALALRAGHDYVFTYYRSMSVALALGQTPYELFLGTLARGADPNSGGRQLSNHFSSVRLRMPTASSVVAGALTHATGAGYAAKVLGADWIAACYFGDGATSKGDFHEALNVAGIHRLPVVFICENNGWAISVPLHLQMPVKSVAERAAAYGMPGVRVDGCDPIAVYHATREAAERARAGEGPTLIEAVVPRLGPHSSQDDHAYRPPDEFAEAQARDPLPRFRAYLLARGILTEEQERALREEVYRAVLVDQDRAEAMALPEPRRARRWLYAGDPPHESLLVPSPLAPQAARPAGARPASPPAVAHADLGSGTEPELTLVEAIQAALRDEMQRDPAVVVLGEDVGLKGGVFRATKGLLEEFGPLRVLDTPVAEIAIGGMAVGAAMCGLRPVAEFQFADYMHPAFDQIVNQAATIRWRSVGAWGCPVVFRAPFGGGVRGGIYHSQSVEAVYCHIPGLKVVVPATPRDAYGLLKSAIRDDDPVLFFEHKLSYRREREPVPVGTDFVVPLGVARLDRPGRDLSIITYGIGVHWARVAAAQLAREGIETEILDLRTLLPLDRAAIAETVRKTSRALVLHEANKTMGIGAEVTAFIAEELFEHLDAPPMRIAAADCHLPYNAPEEDAILPNPQMVVEAARRLVQY
jgi:2-oxoisovalerate dehydrogenase E1 component